MEDPKAQQEAGGIGDCGIDDATPAVRFSIREFETRAVIYGFDDADDKFCNDEADKHAHGNRVVFDVVIEVMCCA